MQQKPDAEQEVHRMLITLRVIIFALVMGLATFTGYTLVADSPDLQQKAVLWLYMAGFAGAALCCRMVVPGLIFRRQRQQIADGTWRPKDQSGPPPKSDEGKLMAALQTKTIVACALLEGPGFANAYAYLVERQVTSLAISAAFILMIAAHFPLRFWLDGWLEQEKRRVDETRFMPQLDHVS